MNATEGKLLVDAIRMLERAEIIDHSGHCSARRDAGSFYINSGASLRSALSSADIVAVDLTARSSKARAAAARVSHAFGNLPRAAGRARRRCTRIRDGRRS